MAILQDLTQANARIAELEAKLKASKSGGKLTLKVSAKGALSVYGMGKWPVTLYKGQWQKLIAIVPAINEFIETHGDELAVKD